MPKNKKTVKKWYWSKRFWLAIVATGIGVVGAIQTGGNAYVVTLAFLSGLQGVVGSLSKAKLLW